MIRLQIAYTYILYICGGKTVRLLEWLEYIWYPESSTGSHPSPIDPKNTRSLLVTNRDKEGGGGVCAVSESPGSV